MGPQIQFSERLCCCSVTKSYPTLCNPMDYVCQAPLSSTIFWSLLKFMFIESVMTSNLFILCHLLLLISVFPSIRVFSNELALCIRLPKYWNFIFSKNPSKNISLLCSFFHPKDPLSICYILGAVLGT